MRPQNRKRALCSSGLSLTKEIIFTYERLISKNKRTGILYNSIIKCFSKQNMIIVI